MITNAEQEHHAKTVLALQGVTNVDAAYAKMETQLNNFTKMYYKDELWVEEEIKQLKLKSRQKFLYKKIIQLNNCAPLDKLLHALAKAGYTSKDGLAVGSSLAGITRKCESLNWERPHRVDYKNKQMHYSLKPEALDAFKEYLGV